MAAHTSHGLLLTLTVLCHLHINAVYSQSNYTNATDTPITTTLANTTVFFTTTQHIQHSAVICVEDEEYGKADFYRIIGNYEQQNETDAYGYPIWKHDSTFTVNSNMDWEIYFDHDTYFNWVIGVSSAAQPRIAAVCNDSLAHSPVNCSQWHELLLSTASSATPMYIKSTTLLLREDICPSPELTLNTTNYCIKSNSNSLDGMTGTYTQLIEGVPDWFYQDANGEIAILHWSEQAIIDDVTEEEGYGWIINLGLDAKATCVYSNATTPPSDPRVPFYPTLCTQWRNEVEVDDNTFDIDYFECKEDVVETSVQYICVEYIISTYSEWSGVYVLASENITINDHSVWTLIGNADQNAEYNLMYYDFGDGWIITAALDIEDFIASTQSQSSILVDEDMIIAICDDKLGDTGDPSLCAAEWSVKNGTVGTHAVIRVVGNMEECDAFVPITTTPETVEETTEEMAITDMTTEIPVTVTSDLETVAETTEERETAGAGSNLLGFQTSEYVAIGAALLVFLVCIICVVCYQRRKGRNKVSEDHGISLQPYVPTGMAYDSYKQNQLNQEAASKGRSSTRKTSAPILVQSAGIADPEVDDVDPKNADALIDLFDEDGAAAARRKTTTDGDDENPFLKDEIIKTGQTQTFNSEGVLPTQEVLDVFDD